MKRFNNLPYQFGLKIRLYSDYRQIAIIKTNSNVSRYWCDRQLRLDYYGYDIKNCYGCCSIISNSLIQRWYDGIYKKRKLTYAKRMYHWLNDKKIGSLACNLAYFNHKQA